MHLSYIHRMRAIAILMIVFVHATDKLDWGTGDRTLVRFLDDLLQGSTVLFFMIAGYLFHHLSRKFDFGDYLVKKFKNVIVPFALVSAPGVAYVVARPAEFLAAHPDMVGAPDWQLAAYMYLFAGTQPNYPLWFVPIMATFFLFGALFVALTKRPGLFNGVLALSLIYSHLSHRPEVFSPNHVGLTLYYLSPYLLGMWASMYRPQVNRWVDDHVGLLGLMFVGLLMGFFLLTPHEGAYVDKPFNFSKGYVDWVLMQKLVLFFFLIGLLRKIENRKTPVLEYLAEVSFPIFFLHMYFMDLYYYMTPPWKLLPGNLLTLAFMGALGLGGSLATVALVKFVLRRHSRYVIGA